MMVHRIFPFLRVQVLSLLVFFMPFHVLTSEDGMYQKCLQYRLQNDSEYKLFQLELDIAETKLKKTKNSSLANLELGLSEASFSISKEKNRTGYSFAPYVNFSLPIYNNTGLKLTAPTNKIGDAKTNTFNITAFTELYGITRKSKQLELLEAQERRDNALKNYTQAEQHIEKKLLQELKELFGLYLQNLDKKLKEAQATIAYEQLKVQGYGEASIKMRSGKLDLLATQRDLKEADFNFQRKYHKFLHSCGIGTNEMEIETKEEPKDVATNAFPSLHSLKIEDFLAFLFESIPKMELISLNGFGAENYVKLQDAKKAYEIKKKRDQLSIQPLVVTAESGITHSKKSLPSLYGSSQAQEKTEQSFVAGVGVKLPGTKIMAGLDFPFDEKRRGDVQFKFGFAINPIEIWNYTLEKKNIANNDAIERIKLQDKIEAFDIVWEELTSKRNFIEWQNKMAEEQFLIYQANLQEYEEWLKRGLIGKSQKQGAEIEYEKAKVRQLDAIIATNSFNIETSLLFGKSEK